MTTPLINAFTEEQAARLAGLSSDRLAYWDRTGFFAPSLGYENRRSPYSRIYTYKDVVGLRILGALRQKFRVPLQHLRKVTARLRDTDQAVWSDQTLFVKDRQVYFQDELGTYRNALSDEPTLPDLPLRKVIDELQRDIAAIARRPRDEVGRIDQRRHVARNAPVISGTRIPVDAIKEFHDAGYSTKGILEEYPSLKRADVEAALSYFGLRAA